MLKILLTSVGSLIGQNILDALETRRSRLKLIGLNTLAENPQLFRCDKAYLSPPTVKAAEFENFLLRLLQVEEIDLVLSCRDQDTLFLSALRERRPELATKIPYATSALASISLDKWQSFCFAQSHQLPFAESLLVEPKVSDSSLLRDFGQRCGWPLIAKPALDSDAAAVRLVRSQDELETLLQHSQKPFLLQEYLGQAENSLKQLEQLNFAPPLYYQTSDTWHISCQSLMAGSPQAVFCSYDQHVLGRSERFEPYQSPELTSLTQAYVQAYVKAGGFGPFNLQCRQDRKGQWKAFAINLRFGGNTFSRWQSGFDEIGYLIRAFAPDLDFPLSVQNQQVGLVLKTLRNWSLPHHWLAELKQNGYWQQSEH